MRYGRLGEDVAVEPSQRVLAEYRDGPAVMSTRFPLMPAFTTPTSRPSACSRRASSSGQRLLVSEVDAAPSVIESPKATIV